MIGMRSISRLLQILSPYGWEEKSQHRADSFRPSRFVVRASGNMLIVQVDVGPPATCLEPTFQQTGIRESGRSLRVANVQPDARPARWPRFIYVPDDVFLTPPDGGRKRCKPAENL